MSEHTIDRREFLGWAAGGAAALALGWPQRVHAFEASEAFSKALASSPLAYISPLRSDGSESRCHAEIWFVADGGDLVVVTAQDGWRARAVEKGLERARIWVGDHGVWTVAKGAWKDSPSCVAEASLVTESEAHARLLDGFGVKYPDGWDKWGPRFERGLEDGSRVMIRYRPTSA